MGALPRPAQHQHQWYWQQDAEDDGGKDTMIHSQVYVQSPASSRCSQFSTSSSPSGHSGSRMDSLASLRMARSLVPPFIQSWGHPTPTSIITAATMKRWPMASPFISVAPLEAEDRYDDGHACLPLL